MKYWDENCLTEECKKEIESCKDLDKLFEIWKSAQAYDENFVEPEYTLKDVVTKGCWIDNVKMEKDSFIKDGYINESEFNDSNHRMKKILVVLKESNILSKKNFERWKAKGEKDDWYKKEALNPSKRNQIGWYKDFADGEEFDTKKNRIINHGRVADNKERQIEKIARMGNYIQNNNENIELSYKELQKSLNKMAFININKRGGSKSANAKDLKEYCNRYKEFIIKEIEICNPDVVIWCATECSEYICDIIERIKEDNNKTVDIIEMIHTAGGKYIRLDDEEIKDSEMLNKYNRLIKEKKIEKNQNFVLNRDTEKYMKKFIYRVEKDI